MLTNQAERATPSTLKSAQTTRFSLLLLENGEYFLDDFSVVRFVEPTLDTHKKVAGRLKVCTRSLFFVPADVQLPILRFPFVTMTTEPRAECFATFPVTRAFVAAAIDNLYVTITTTRVTEMKTRGVDHAYRHHRTTAAHGPTTTATAQLKRLAPAAYRFTLLYSRIDVLLASIHVVFTVARAAVLSKSNEHQLLAPVLAARRPRTFDSSLLVDFREKLLLFEPALVERVEPLLTRPGCLMLTTHRVYFQPAQLNNLLDPVCQCAYETITHVIKRRHLLRPTGLELLLTSDNSLLFAFATRDERDAVCKLLLAQRTARMHCCVVPRPFTKSNASTTSLSTMRRRWQQRQLSNFSYLTFLNSVAGRTRNDLTQYPVFPWVVADYTSVELDLAAPQTFRDLSQPIGALNPTRLATFRTRFDAMPRGQEADGLPPPFLYGTHYSTPGYVLYFLVRLAPQHMLSLQNGKFDAPDRLFSSIASTWRSVNTNATDLKELIPEFYDTASLEAGSAVVTPNDWLCNAQHLDLGTTQRGERVDDVELPPWACNDPRQFVEMNRAALESAYVSAHLHEWIDLIFGYKQQGDAAIQANNLFYYLSYEGAIDLERVTDPVERQSLELQIQEFGQTPSQLFTMPHASRNDASDSSDDDDDVEEETTDVLASPRNVSSPRQLAMLLSTHKRPQRRQTYPPPDVQLRRQLPHRPYYSRNRKTLALSSVAVNTPDVTDSDDVDSDVDAAAASASRAALSAAVTHRRRRQPPAPPPRHSLQSRLSFLCLQAPLETAVPRALELSSQLWHTLGTTNSRPAKKWRWHERMALGATTTATTATVQSPDWRWVETLRRPLQIHTGEVSSAVLTHNDATLLTTSKDRSLVIADVCSGRVRQTLTRSLALSCCAVSPDARIVFVGCWDNNVYMYSTRTGRDLDCVVAHADGISAICVVGTRFLTSSWDASVKLWRYTPTFVAPTPVQTFSSCNESVLCLATSTNGAFGAAGTRNGHVCLYNLAAPSLHVDVCVSPTRRGDVAAIAFASDNNSVVCITIANELLQLTLQGELLMQLDVQTPGQVRCLDSDGAFAIGGTTNGRIVFWKLYNNDCSSRKEDDDSAYVCEIANAHDTIISALVVSADGTTIVSGAVDGSVRVWQFETSMSDVEASAGGSSSRSEFAPVRRKSSVPRAVATAAAAASARSSCSTTALLAPRTAVSSVEPLQHPTSRTSATAATSRQRISRVAVATPRDVSEHLRPLLHLYRADVSFTMEEAHFCFET